MLLMCVCFHLDLLPAQVDLESTQTRQDRNEHTERIAAEWSLQLECSRPAPPVSTPGTRLALDFTEGPHRQRKKLLVQRINERVETDALPQSSPAVPHTATDVDVCTFFRYFSFDSHAEPAFSSFPRALPSVLASRERRVAVRSSK